MNEPFPLGCYREVIAQVAQSVYGTMLQLPVQEVRPRGLLESSFTGAVYYSGAWQGALLLECARAQAIDWARRYLPPMPEIELDDARDCLGELTNVIAGNLKPLLPPGVALSFPSVVQGSDYCLRLCGGNLSETIYLEDGIGPFRLALVEVIDPPGGRRTLPDAA
jgi:chemotaxis protein CheX